MTALHAILLSLLCIGITTAATDGCEVQGNSSKASQYPWAAPRSDALFCDSFARFRAERAADQRNGSLVGEVVYYGDSILAIYGDNKRNDGPLGGPVPSRYWAIGGETPNSLMWRINNDNDLAGLPANVAVVSIGTNNLKTNVESSQSDYGTCETTTGSHIAAIINELLNSNPNTRILLLQLLPRGQCCSADADLRWPNAWSTCRDLVNVDLRRRFPLVNLTLVGQGRAALMGGAVEGGGLQYNVPPEAMMVDCSWLLLTNPDAAQPQSLNPTTIADGLHPSAAGYQALEQQCWGPVLQYMQRLPTRGAPPGPASTTYYNDIPARDVSTSVDGASTPQGDPSSPSNGGPSPMGVSSTPSGVLSPMGVSLSLNGASLSPMSVSSTGGQVLVQGAGRQNMNSNTMNGNTMDSKGSRDTQVHSSDSSSSGSGKSNTSASNTTSACTVSACTVSACTINACTINASPPTGAALPPTAAPTAPPAWQRQSVVTRMIAWLRSENAGEQGGPVVNAPAG